MHIRIILVAIALGFGQVAAADFTTIERAYEVPLSLLRIPASTSGSVMFRECAQCEQFSVPVTSNTEFSINGKAVLLRDFRKSLFKIRDRESEVITVRRNLQSNTITAVKLAQ
jgi:hypothetical protein